jgi:hypothetical protein
MEEAHLAIIADLNRQLEEATAELRASLRAGIDPLRTRHRIQAIEADLTSAVQRAAHAKEEGRQRATEEAMRQGSQLAVEAATRVAEALRPFEFTEDHSMNNFNVDAQAENIRHFANHLALCCAEQERALTAHAAAEAEVKTLQDRISSIESRRAAITKARVAGTYTPHDANEFVALGADAEELHKMLAEAKHSASALLPSEAIAAVARAEEALQSAETEAIFAALTSRARDIEDSLLRTVRALHATGKKLKHHHHSVSYRSNDELRKLISYGVV